MIAVVHLVWGPLGAEPLRRFLRSYRDHPSGADHELVILFNGVSADQRELLLAELSDVEHRSLELREPVQDLAAYAEAAVRLEHQRLCFLNSYSEIIAGGWLAKLDAALLPGVGAAGATGSWASLRSLAFNGLHLPNGYRGALPNRRAVFAGMEQMQRDLQLDRGEEPQQPSRPRLPGLLDVARSTAEQVVRFPGFPDPHLRTNAFICERERFASLELTVAGRKVDAYALESGRRSITRRLAGLGLRTVVVDREGVSHGHEAWPESRTFWQGDQEGLLVADNQTGAYTSGDPERRRLLAGLAWGGRAQPLPRAALVR